MDNDANIVTGDRLAGIILCGGRSTRMGYPKALLPFGPQTMIERVIDRLRPAVQRVVVVCAPGQTLPRLAEDVETVEDERTSEGPLEGIRGGLSALRLAADAAFITSCDAPWLEPGFVLHLLQRLEDHQICMPVDDHFRHPLASIYRTGLVPLADRLLAAGERRPMALTEHVKTAWVPIDELRKVDPRLQTLDNMNRPEDYLRNLDRAGFPVEEKIRAVLSRGSGGT